MAQEFMRPKLYGRVIYQDSEHVKVQVFDGGANSGELCLSWRGFAALGMVMPIEDTATEGGG